MVESGPIWSDGVKLSHEIRTPMTKNHPKGNQYLIFDQSTNTIFKLLLKLIHLHQQPRLFPNISNYITPQKKSFFYCYNLPTNKYVIKYKLLARGITM